MVHVAKLPLGSAGEHINPFGDGLKMLFEAVELLLKVGFLHTGKYSMAGSSLDHLVGACH